MTTRKSKTVARKYTEPAEKLIRAESVRFSLPPEKLRAVLSAFGPMPEKGQRELLHHLYLVLVEYWFQQKTQRAGSKTVTPSEARKRLKMIDSAARRLLGLCEVNSKAVPSWFLGNVPNPTPSQQLSILQRPRTHNTPAPVMGQILMRLVTAGINHRDWDRDRVDMELAAASNRAAEAVKSLLWLRSQAEAAEREIRTRKGRGGPRNHPTPNGTLIRGAITVYVHLRNQYPGAPMLQFIRAVAALVGENVTDHQIMEVWSRFKSKIDLNPEMDISHAGS